MARQVEESYATLVWHSFPLLFWLRIWLKPVLIKKSDDEIANLKIRQNSVLQNMVFCKGLQPAMATVAILAHNFQSFWLKPVYQEVG